MRSGSAQQADTYADVCGRMLSAACADVCWRMLTGAEAQE